MYLKRLELLGFKTFVARTELLFDSDITAIVGPNGSGKSNVADAVRWVLGEQSARALRIKRTEDVIFGGSAARSRLGMAEVSITFDNTAHWLPLDFTEVTITRRAYRSGENEYFINRGRVRLRDVVDLLLAANIGQNNYTVIGQGTVDAALSLRPEERRGLFEEAADIKRYQVKRSEALEKLAATEANLVRIGDILAEIGPRLQVLKDQAARAQEHADLTAELRGHLAAWYRHLWTRGHDTLAAAQAADAAARATLASLQGESDARTGQLAALRDAERDRRASLGDWHRQASDLHARSEALERRLAVDRERAAQFVRQRQDLLQEAASLEATATGESQRLAAAASETDRLTARSHDLAREVQQTQAALAAVQDEQKRLQHDLNAAQDQSFAQASAAADSRQRLSSLSERRAELSRTLAEAARSSAVAAGRAVEMNQRLAAAVAAAEVTDGESRGLTAERNRLQTELAASQDRLPGLQAALNQRQQARQGAQTRLELLSRLTRDGEGYAAGVRTVLAASGAGRLPGMVGTVASRLQAPPELETAIETALGGHLQDIITDTWDHAAAAIALLKESKSGRCTFWPINTVRPAHGGGRAPSAHAEGVLGPALDLVRFDEAYRPVFTHLLGGILVVRDLDAARAVQSAGSAATLVTLTGELVRPAGSLTGGAPERSGGVLAREREVRALPEQIAALEAGVTAAQDALDAERRRAEEMTARTRALEVRQRDLSARRTAEATEESKQRQQAARVEQEVAWLASSEQQARREMDALDRREADLKAALAATEEKQNAAKAALDDLRTRLTAADSSAAQAALSDARTAAAVADQALRSQRALADSIHASHARLIDQAVSKQRRAAELEAAGSQLLQQSEAAQAEAGLLAAQIAELQRLIEPAEAALAGSEAEQTALASADAAARPHLLEAERLAARAAVEVTRAQEELAKLQGQIEAEDVLRAPVPSGEPQPSGEDLPGMADFPHQLRMDLAGAGGRVSPLVTPPESRLAPEQVKRQVDRLRSQLRALGAVNPGAVLEYEETQKRHQFLSTQADDLQQAGKSLRAVVTELDGIMKRRFTETFKAVAEQFKHYFGLLFAGGTARLILTDPDDPSLTGIDIVAQPPGKRMQSLALLSGGERALTATALLFAILAVNPSPLCLLDEVDAALDEANVGRFTQTLKGLSERTQFVLITHNRGTMEMASALYGVSMGDDGASRLISLKLDEAREQGVR